MASPTLLLTKLDAVNMMLASIGQTPLNTLSVSGIKDASIAQLALDNTTRETLTKGWTFNTDYDYSLVPDVDNNILVPNGALSIVPNDTSKSYVIRWDEDTAMLYDAANNTFTISDNPLKCTIIWGFEFENIPQAARNYIATRAARVFQSQVVGSDILFKYTAQHEAEAFAILKQGEARLKRKNIFASSNSTNVIFKRDRVPS